MNSTSHKLKEIILLNRQLRNALSFRGGARKLTNFKEKLIEHKVQIFYLYIISFFTILYLCSINLPHNKKFIGGAPEDEGFMKQLSNIIGTINNAFYKLIDKLYELLKPTINKITNFITKKTSEVHEKILEQTKQLSGTIDEINDILDIIYDQIFKTLFTRQIVPIFYGTGIILVPFMPLVITILVITYISCNFILDSKLYLPCYGCEEGNSFYKCWPGTGKGSIGCTIYTEFINKIKLILKQLRHISNFVNIVKNAIMKAINSILYLVFHISGWFYKVFGTGIEKIFALLKFLKRIEVPDNWGFNFGEFIICPDFSTKGKDCIYNKDGSLRSRHGNNPLFHTFWKMIRIILEIPPDIPKFPFSGGVKIELDNVEVPTVTEPTIKRHDVDTTVKTTQDRPPPSAPSKIPPFDKNIIYKKLLEGLIKIEINPIKWIAALFNLLIDAINAIIDQFINLLKIIISFIFMLITLVVKSLTSALGKVVNKLLKPLYEVSNLVLKLPKQLFKSISKIFDIGIFTIITHFFYEMLISFFPFLDKIRSFMIIIAIIILIQSILIYCPIIGGLYAFYTPIMYIYNSYLIIKEYSQNYNKIFNDLHYFLIDKNPLVQKIKEYILNMKEIYQIISIVIIVIIIIFIILNYFVNVNRYFIKIIYSLIYGHYYNKFDIVRKQFMKYKLLKLEREKNEVNYIKDETDKKQSTTYFRINNLRKLNYNELKKLY